jgi:hypothetical protein
LATFLWVQRHFWKVSLWTSYRPLFKNEYSDAVRVAENTPSEHIKWDIYFCDGSNRWLESGSISNTLYWIPCLSC